MLLDSRTRPVHQILESLLPPESLAYALRLWSNEYVHQQNISMLSFVDAFYHRQPLPYSRQHIYSSLLPALMEVLTIRSTFDESTTDLYEFPDYDQPGGMTAIHSGSTTVLPPEAFKTPPTQAPVPVAPPVQHAVVQQAASVSVSVAPRPKWDEKFLAFSTFVRKLMESLPAEKRKKMLFYYRKNFIKAVPGSIAPAFYEWLQGNEECFEHTELDTQSMSNVVHSIYTGLCNYLGPLDADDVLMKSANFIDTNFDKDKFDVRDLL